MSKTATPYGLKLGARIRKTRKRRTLTLRGLAVATGISYGYLCEIEHGHSIPTLDKADRLANILGVPLKHLCPPQ